MTQPATLVIGSNSYLGINLCRALNPGQTVLMSASANTPENWDFQFIQGEIGKALTGLENQGPFDRVFILARPETQENGILETFYSTLFGMMEDLLKRNPYLEIHFLSSSLVYASDSPEELTEQSPVAPIAPYEVWKKRFEDRLCWLSEIHPGSSVHLHRIPLLVGGVLRPSDRKKQLFYAWFAQFLEGRYWLTGETDPGYGTSWLNIPDWVHWVLRMEKGRGHFVWLPCSGRITYSCFMKEAWKKLLYKPATAWSRCPRSFLYLKNNSGVPPGEFWDCFNP